MSEGKRYLSFVTEKLKERIREVSQSISQGEQEIQGMHEYYWENYTGWTSMAMKILITSRRFWDR